MKKTKPRPYQLKGIRAIEQRFNFRALLADDMGLGKSFQALKVIQRNRYEVTPAVIICPASLKWNWSDEILKHTGLTAEVLSGRKAPRFNRKALVQSEVYIINFEILSGWKRWLGALKPAMIVIDECQAIKNPGTKRTKNTIHLIGKCDRVVAMSGTPFENSPVELYTILNALWPEEFHSHFQFAQRYSKPRLMPWGWVYKGGRNLLELNKRLLKIGMIRRKRADVLHELPAKTIEVVPLELPRTAMAEYKEVQTDLIRWLNKQSRRKAKKAKKAKKMVRIGYLRRFAAQSKIELCAKQIEEFLTGTSEKMIIFGVHTSILKPLYDRFKAQAVLIDGSSQTKKRHMLVDDFKKNPKKRLAICNIEAAGVGLNMQAATHVGFVELPWTPTKLDQAIARAHRMGQTKGVYVRIWVARNTIEEKLCSVLQDKQWMADSVLDGNEESNELAIFDMLEEQLLELS